jgi:plasmid stabilization system protein ParE
MIKYRVILSDKAERDIYDIFDYIFQVYKQPVTAVRYMARLNKAIQKLSAYAGSIAISQSHYIQSHYGGNARRVNHERLAIIYVIDDNACVHIKRIISGSLVL